MKNKRFLSFDEVIKIIQTLRTQYTWDQVSDLTGVKKGTLYRAVIYKEEPKREDIREKLGLEPLCPYCSKPPRRRKRSRMIRDMSIKDLKWALENREEL